MKRGPAVLGDAVPKDNMAYNGLLKSRRLNRPIPKSLSDENPSWLPIPHIRSPNNGAAESKARWKCDGFGKYEIGFP